MWGGTNGKGSTTLKIARSLQCEGRRVGVYTSPHIASFQERIEINGETIGDKEVDYYLPKIFSVIDKEGLSTTFFEILTLLALLFFRDQKVDVAVIEVGMGGRLDATNIIRPLCTIITSIGLDHSRYLGKNLEEIAAEKGGIVKENVPLLLGPQAANQKVLHRIAALKNSPCHIVKGDFDNYEEENKAIAWAALKILPYEKISLEGLEATPACRFQLFSENSLVLDVAHNPPAFHALFKRLNALFPNKKFSFLVAFSSDKEIEKILDILIQRASFITLTKASHSRSISPSQIAQMLKERGYTSFLMEEDIKTAFEKGRVRAKEKAEIFVVTGSFYIMKEVREALSINEKKDLYSTPF